MKNIKTSFRSLKMLIKNHPSFLIVQIIDLICNVVKSLIPIDLAGRIIEIYQDPNGTFNDALKITFYYIIILVIVTSISSLVELVVYLVHTHFKLFFSVNLFRKLDSVDYDFHEQENFLDNYTRALDNGGENIYNVANNQIQLIKRIVQSVSVFSVIIASNYLGVIYSIVIAIIFYIFRRLSSKTWFKQRTYERHTTR